MTSIYESRPWLKQYPGWLPHEIVTTTETALGDFERAAGLRPSSAAIHFFDQTISYQRTDRLSNALAAAFRDLGVRAGDRVIVDLQNVPQFAVATYATWKLGAIVVPLNPMYKEAELAYFCRDSGAKLFLAHDETAAGLKLSFLKETPVQNVVTTSPRDLLDPAADCPELLRGAAIPPVPGTLSLTTLLSEYEGKAAERREVLPTDIGYLTYTSGTTGSPKGAMNTQGNIAFNARVYQAVQRITPDDVLLGVAPLFHVTGQVAHLAIAALAGIPVILSYRFDPAETLRLIERWKATVTVAAITVYIAWMNDPDIARRDLSSFVKAYSGGAPVSAALVERFEKLTGLYIHNVYGMTETTSPSHITPLGTRAPVDPDSGALSVGLPVPGSVAKIVDAEQDARELPPGEVGEIVERGPMIVPGYWQKPAETAHAIRDGWLFTGDVGKMDEQGWFYLVDRKKDMIIASGFKVWPRDVEDVIYQHPAVKEAAVVGVSDPYRGETVKAFVALKQGMEQTVTPEEIIAFCKERMAAYKYPRAVEFVPEIPKTATGKFLRRVLRDKQNG